MRLFSVRSIRNRFILAFLTITLSAILIITLVMTNQISAVLTERAQQNSYQVTLSRARAVESRIVGLESNIFYLTNAPAMIEFGASGLTPAVKTHMRTLLSSFFTRQAISYEGACILDSSGNELICLNNQGNAPSFTPDPLLQNRKEARYFSAPLNASRTAGSALPVYISDASLATDAQGKLETPQTPILYYSTTLTDRLGTVYGVVVLKARLAPIFDSLVKDDPAQSILLVDTDGTYLLHPNPGLQYGGLLKVPKASIYVQQPADSRIIVNKVSGYLNSSDLRDTLIAYDHITPPGADYIKWVLIYVTPLSTISSTLTQVIRTPVLIAVSLILIVSLLAVVIARSITEPLARLTAAARGIASGDLETAIPAARGGNEITTLTSAFSTMIGTLKKLLTQATQTTRINIAISQSANPEALMNAVRLAVTDVDQLSLRLFYTDDYNAPIPGTLSLATALSRDTHLSEFGKRAVFSPRLARNAQQCLFLSDLKTDPETDPALRSLFQGMNATSAAVLPLINAGRWQGVVGLSWPGKHLFSDDERTFLNAILQTLAASVANMRSVQMAHSAEENSSARAADLETMLSMTTELNPTLAPPVLIEWLTERVQEKFPVRLAIGAEPAKTRFSLPISIDGAPWGNAGFDMQDDYLTDDKKLILRLLSQQIASALQTSYLYERQVDFANRMRALDHTKSVFLSNMSHELRTPLNIIIGYTSLMLQQLKAQDPASNPYADFADLLPADAMPVVAEAPNPYQRLIELQSQIENIMSQTLPLDQEALNRLLATLDVNLPGILKNLTSINEKGLSLLTLVNDLLDLSKIESGRLDLVLAPVAVSHLTEHIRTNAQGLAERMQKTHIGFQASVADGMPQTIIADRTRLEQIIDNLLSNAYKFTLEGNISVDLKPLEKDKFVIQVTDSGIGIAPENREIVFDEFKQIQEGFNRNYGGTGLGLAITRNLILMMDGTVRLESELGKGSVFTITLPTGGAQ